MATLYILAMSISIIDYGAGNIHSIAKAVAKVAGGKDYKITNNPADILESSHVILPGVGAFGDCAQGLRAIEGLEDAIKKYCNELKRPFLGICVGMQLLAERGYENGEFEGLGLIEGAEVIHLNDYFDSSLRALRRSNPLTDLSKPTNSLMDRHVADAPRDDFVKIPHMGWNEVLQGKESEIFNTIEDSEDFYFVHSYAMSDNECVTATCDYGFNFPCAVQKGNIYGVQFHPEKSATAGLKLIENFLKI